jgi:hypothetical protein
MGDDLMAIQVEVDPEIAAAPFRATHDAAVKGAGRRKIMHRKGDMEGSHA